MRSKSTILTILMATCIAAVQPEGLSFTRSRSSRSISSRQRGTNGTSEVGAILSGVDWITSIKVGGQVLRVQIDTGSSDLWFISTLSDSETRDSFSTHTFFDPSKSPTWAIQPDIKYNATYDIGELAAFGVVGTETVEVGGVTVTDMLMGAATHIIGGTGTLDPAYDGIMGMGWSAGVHDFTFPNGSSIVAPTFMQVAQDQLEQPVFTCDFRANEPETISFGFVNSSLYTGSLNKLPIDNSTGFWTVNNVAFSSGGQQLSSSAGLDIIFDTGGLGTTVDPQTAKAYWDLVPGSSITRDGDWTFPCKTAVLPDLVLTFPTGATATLKGPALNETAHRIDEDTCFGGVQVTITGFPNAGNSFYGAYFTVWNQQEPSLSFAPYSDVQDTAGSNEANIATATNALGVPMATAGVQGSSTATYSNSTTYATPPATIVTAGQNMAGRSSSVPVLGLFAMAFLNWVL